MLVIKNGRVIDPSCNLDEQMDIAIDNKKIIALNKSIDVQMDDEVIDAKGCIVAPGFVDLHVHFRDPGLTYKEDLTSGALAAVRGGFTDVVCMANTKPVVDHTDILNELMDRAKDSLCTIHFAAAISKSFDGSSIVNMKELKQCGAVFFTDDGLPLKDAAFVKAAMREAKANNMMLSFHEEDATFIKEPGINHGAVAKSMNLYGADREAEIVMVKRDIALAKETGVHIHIQHISAKKTVDLIRQAKADNIQVSCEVTPHHLALTQDDVLIHGTNAKMNPPLRLEEDRIALIHGLQDGTIDCIATDHAPHSDEEKSRIFTAAPSGIIGLETSLAVCFTYLVDKGHISIGTLIEKMSCTPSRFIQLDSSIRLNNIANLTIFDPQRILDTSVFLSKSKNTPFHHAKLYGTVMNTICNGNVVYSLER